MLDHQSLRGKKLYREKVQVPTKELRIGMFVTELDRPWVQSPFTIKGFIVKNLRQLQQLQQCCKYVYVDYVKSKKLKLKEDPVIPQQSDAVDKIKFDRELLRAKPLYSKTYKLIENLFTTQTLDQAILAEMDGVVAEGIQSVMDNAQALRWLTLQQGHSAYLINHVIRVFVMALNLGKEVELSSQQMHILGLSALLHDIGMLSVPSEVLDKEQLTPEEILFIQQHPLRARKMLAGVNIDAEVIKVIECHHERLDGKGYPKNLANYDIPYLSKILAIADVYVAQTSNRSYKDAVSSLDALRSLMVLRDSHFDETLVIKFIRMVGVYPVGSIASLTDGRVGLVLPSTYEKRMKPDILVLQDSQGQSVQPYLLSMEGLNPSAEAQEEELKIAKIHPDGAFDINYQEFAEHSAFVTDTAS